MSIQFIAKVWDDDTFANSGEKLVALKLADNANDEGHCYPHIRTVARHTQMTDRTVQRHVKALEDRGWLVRSRSRRRNGTYSGYQFWIVAYEPGDKMSGGFDEPGDKMSSGPGDKMSGHEPSKKGTIKETSIPKGHTGDAGASRQPAREVAQQTPNQNGKPVQHRIFDGLVAVLGEPPASGTSERGKWNRAVKELTKAGLREAEDVEALAGEYRARWPDIDMTPIALANNAHHLITSPRPAGRKRADGSYSIRDVHADKLERIRQLEREGR